MTANLGSMDRKVRLAVASTMYWMVVLGLVRGLWALLPMLIATMMVVTWHEGYCPIYRLFGWSTHRTARRHA
jgi:DUF2892 family protein